MALALTFESWRNNPSQGFKFCLGPQVTAEDEEEKSTERKNGKASVCSFKRHFPGEQTESRILTGGTQLRLRGEAQHWEGRPSGLYPEGGFRGVLR